MASGHTSRNAPCRRRRMRRTISTGRNKPKTPKHPATLTARVMASTTANASTAQTTCAAISWPGPTPSTPA